MGTMLERAKAVSPRRSRKNLVSLEELEVAMAYARGEVNSYGIQDVFALSNAKNSGALVGNLLICAVSQGLLVIAPDAGSKP